MPTWIEAPHWLTGIFTLVLAICGYLQLRILREGAAQTDKLIEAYKMNAVAAQDFSTSARLIDKGIEQAVNTLAQQDRLIEQARLSSEKASRQTLEEGKENYRLEHRAWITIDDFSLTRFEVGSSPEAIVKFANNGKTPAMHVRGGFQRGAILKRDATQQEINANTAIAKSLSTDTPLPAVGPMGILVMHPRDPLSLTQEAYNQVRTKSYDMYFLGRIEYDDVFNANQWMTICLKIQFLNEKPELRYCSSGNDTSYKMGD